MAKKTKDVGDPAKLHPVDEKIVSPSSIREVPLAPPAVVPDVSAVITGPRTERLRSLPFGHVTKN